MSTVAVHLCPLEGSGLTGCCSQPPLLLPRTDKITSDPDLVTCGTTRMVCPWCAAPTDEFSDLSGTGKTAGPGHIAICAYCAEPSMMTDELGLRKLTEDETRIVAADPLARRLRDAVYAVRRRFPDYPRPPEFL